MKRLVDTRDLAKNQQDELVLLLRQERIPVHENPTNFMDFAALWVPDEHFARAQDILRTESSVYSARARAKWERQWRTEFRSSWIRWFAHRLFRSPAGTIIQVLLLMLFVGLFVVYPLLYVARRAI